MKLDPLLLEELYVRFNHRRYVHPDPLEYVYGYQGNLDREIVGMIASSLAYGRVRQILGSVSRVLHVMGPSPGRFLQEGSLDVFQSCLKDFRHRFTSGEQLALLFEGMRRVLHRHGSLETCFKYHLTRCNSDAAAALAGFAGELGDGMDGRSAMLLPSPEKGSACKRLNLFLRWMIRRDAVDPGVWNGIPTDKLIVPLDTHMHRVALRFGLTQRKQADMRTALEVTNAFRQANPEDPVRYDFVLTRFGISSHEDFSGDFFMDASFDEH